MTTFMALLPVAISGLVGVIVGFHYEPILHNFGAT